MCVESTHMKTHEKILYTFNKFYSNMIKDLKSKQELASSIKHNYKVFDKLSENYYTTFWSTFSGFIGLLVNESRDHLLNNDAFLQSILIKDLTIGEIFDVITDDAEKSITWNYLYVLLTIGCVYNTYDSSAELTDDEHKQLLTLYEVVLRLIGMIQKSEDYVDVIEDIVDDDIKGLLTKIIVTHPKADKTDDIQPSKIMGLAKEISESIDVSSLNLESPQDVLKMLDFSGSNNVLTDIIGKVSTSIQGKISSGELDKNELFGEAMSMLNGNSGNSNNEGGLGNLFNSPIFAEMMKGVGKNTQTKKTGEASYSTKERLRRKLELKKKHTTY